MNAELYQVPSLALLAALVAVFGALWLEGLTQPARLEEAGEAPSARRRQLLWLAGWVCVVIRLAIQVAGWTGPGWGGTIAEIALQMSALMFLASLAPQYYSFNPRILYVAAFGLPVMIYCVTLGFDPQPGVVGRSIILGCTLLTVWVAVRWSVHRHLVPTWLSLTVVGVLGVAGVWTTWIGHYVEVGMLVHSGVLLMTAILFLMAYRRLTPGLVFTAGGLLLWALPGLVEPFLEMQGLPPTLRRPLNLIKVITAVGMIVLVLEEEIASNQASQQRDRRARLELEKYTGLYLAETPFDEGSGEYDRVCATIAEVSRFSQVAIFTQTTEGTFRLAGKAGMSGALEGALDALARRTTEEKAMEASRGNFFTRVAGSLTMMDLSPLMAPGDELGQMNFRRAYVMGIRTRNGQLRGTLMLSGLRKPEDPLLTEDVLPLETLVTRMGATQEHVALLRRLMQTERLAGLGQLAGGVAHELNNPLQAVTGFAQLLTEGDGTAVREHAGVILAEARRMKQIIESLMRFRNASSGSRAPVSVGLLLRDIERLMRHDLDKAGVALEMNIPEHLPRVKADGEQIRQVFLQVMRNAVHSLEGTAPGDERRLVVEAASIPRAIEVMFSDTGPGFAEPGRAFDPFFTGRASQDGTGYSPHRGDGRQGDTGSSHQRAEGRHAEDSGLLPQRAEGRHAGGPGLGLSICYAIVREHGGEISAVNLHPRGAAVVIELPAFVEVEAETPSEGEEARA